MPERKKSTTKFIETLRDELERNSNIQSQGVDLQKQKQYFSIRFTSASLRLNEDELESKAHDVCEILKQKDFECDTDFSLDPRVPHVGILVGYHRHKLTNDLDFRYLTAFHKFFRSALSEAGLKLAVLQEGGSSLPESECEIPYNVYTVRKIEKTSSEETDKAFEEYTKTIKSLDNEYSKNQDGGKDK